MRKPRILQDEGRYHVIARANHKELLLGPGATKELFLATISRAKKKFMFRVENFTILGNHFHLIVYTPTGSNLSAIMKWILGVFAMAWNRVHQNWGHFWGERFFSRLIHTFSDFEETSRYIDENPVKAALSQSSDTWPYGGAYHRKKEIWSILDPYPLF